MCIRDSYKVVQKASGVEFLSEKIRREYDCKEKQMRVLAYSCLLYTSDAADERSSVDLGGRRIIKKTTKVENQERSISIADPNNRRIHKISTEN